MAPVRKTRRRQRGGDGTPVYVKSLVNFLPEPTSDYLSVCGDNLTSKQSNQLISAMFTGTHASVKTTIRDAIHTLYDRPEICGKRSGWVPCKDTCESTLSLLFKRELSSTAYMLRVLCMSVLTVDEGTLAFRVTGDLTGLWKDDVDKIVITRLGHATSRGRLIMGFGPSASGKTYWAKTLITLLSSIPRTMLAIDGGIYREASFVYKTMVEEAEKICVRGFDNLVLDSWKLGRKSLFSSDRVKEQMIELLKKRTHVPISLYVPETLGDCGWFRLKSCKNKYKPYIDITGDKDSWIGIFIWQHKTAAECDQDTLHKCKGCTASGERREIREGKKYSSGAWEHSVSEGLEAVKTAPGGNYMIHNCGRKAGRSIFEDLSPTKQPALRAGQDIYNYEYLAVA